MSVKLTLTLEQANTFRVALDEWGEANCVREYKECGDSFCRAFAEVADVLGEACERAGVDPEDPLGLMVDLVSPPSEARR